MCMSPRHHCVLHLHIVLSNINGCVGVLLVADLEQTLLLTCCPKAVVGAVQDVTPEAPGRYASAMVIAQPEVRDRRRLSSN